MKDDHIKNASYRISEMNKCFNRFDKPLPPFYPFYLFRPFFLYLCT